MVAGTIVTTYDQFRTIKQVTLAWTCDSSGDVNGLFTKSLSGIIERVTQIPGVSTPTTLYDIALNDADDVDVLAGDGDDQTVTGPTTFYPTKPAPVNSKLELVITNAGNAKNGTVVLYYR